MFKNLQQKKKHLYIIIKYENWFINYLYILMEYFLFSKKFLQKNLKRPSKYQHTKNKKIKNNIIEDAFYFRFVKSILNLNKDKKSKKKVNLLEILNQLWYLNWPNEWKIMNKFIYNNNKRITHRLIHWDYTSKYQIILPFKKKKKKLNVKNKYNIGLTYFYFKLNS